MKAERLLKDLLRDLSPSEEFLLEARGLQQEPQTLARALRHLSFVLTKVRFTVNLLLSKLEEGEK